jgi:integrase
MGNRVRILTALSVSRLKNPGLHFVGMVPGLAVAVTASGSKRWILRFYMNGKRRDMGLGSFPEVSLADAREIAFQKRTLVRQGIDPIEQRRAVRAQVKAEEESNLSFKLCASKYIESHRKGWKNVKHSQQWEATLEKYAYAVIGEINSREVTLKEILKIIEPIWETKTETASRLRGRIEAVLDWATVRGYREGTNPARWKGNLDTLLPARSKVAKVKHFEALPWDKCPEFFCALKKHRGMSIEALKFCILTACRSGEVRGAKWTEIDREKAVWTIPAERMKAGREQRVPLSRTALKLLKGVGRFEGEELVFPSSTGTVLSDMALLSVLRGMTESSTVHGFRSSFRDWAGEATNYPREVIEHALAHQLKDKAEAAYARGDLFTKRVALMESWAVFLETGKYQ